MATIKDPIIKKLYSNNIATTIQAIEEIAQSGNSGYIPMLVDVLYIHENDEVKMNIIKLLSEVKHSDAVVELVKAIENEKYKPLQEVLIRACWENGLDYSNYFTTFIDLLINGEYMVAFEAFTLIENSDVKLTATSTKEYLDRLRGALSQASDDRKILIHSIIQFLPSLIQ